MSKGLESFIVLKVSLLANTKEGKLTSVSDLLNDIEKELKALEIIINKHVSIHNFYKWAPHGLKQYNDSVWDFECLTEEEFNLLKEVLYESRKDGK